MDKSLLKKYNVRLNKAYGQNFIFDTNLLAAIVKDSGVTKDDIVVEIGTGAGSLTKEICKVAKRVISYEIDNNLKTLHDEAFFGIDNVELFYKDIMSIPIAEIDNEFENYKIVANLPYYITTPIIFKFLESKKVKSITIMVQKEVADRIVAKTGTSEYGALTVNVALRANSSIKRFVGRECFVPPPNVDSAIVRMDIVERFDVDVLHVSNLIRAAFSMRRKTLLNNLCALCQDKSKKELEDILLSMNIKKDIRGEKLDVDQFVALAKKLQ